MKKFMFTLMASATLVAGVNAQEGTGGADTSGDGAINGSYIATGLVAAGVIAGIVNNNSANAPVTPPVQHLNPHVKATTHLMAMCALVLRLRLPFLVQQQ